MSGFLCNFAVDMKHMFNTYFKGVNADLWYSIVIICEGDIVKEVMSRHTEALQELSKMIICQTYDRLIDLYKKSPKERYLYLIKSCPEILQQITLKELASYLKITPTYLSRIRKSLLTE